MGNSITVSEHCTFVASKGAPGHVIGRPGQAVLVDQVEHVNRSLIVLLSREEVDY